MKECGKIREQMAAYLAGELSPEGTAALRVHLESCPACREELEELSAAWNLTKSMLDSTAHDGTLPDESRAEIRRAMNPRRRFRVAPALWKIAAMFLVCGAILAVVVHSGRKSEVPRMKMNVFMSAEEVKENVAAAKTAALNRPGAPAPVLKTKREAVKVRAGSAEPMKPQSCDFALRQEAFLAVSAEAVELKESRTAPEILTLYFRDFPEISRKDNVGVSVFFGTMGIELKTEEITVTGDSFEIRSSPEKRRKMEALLEKRRSGMRL